MSAIFLSASVPDAGSSYYETADPFLIQAAVRSLMMTALGRRLIVWGGHPAITPMVWTMCEYLGVEYAKSVVLYQSRYFQDFFPEENKHFANVDYIDAVPNDREASLFRMREVMLAREDLTAAVFIGGMEGILAEHSMFTQFHPEAKIVAVPAPGGAARELAASLGTSPEATLQDVDFTKLFHAELNISPEERRTSQA